VSGSVRVRFTKAGKVRFISHRDVARVWERALRKAGIAVAYSLGFSPRPRLHFGLALSTGHESLGEYLDIDLAGSAPELLEGDVLAQLSGALPDGIDAVGAQPVGSSEVSLQAAVTSCTWSIEVVGAAEAALTEAVAAALSADRLMATRQRKGQDVRDDLRPYLRAVEVDGTTELGAHLTAELGTQPRGLRPAELIAALGGGWHEGRVCRTHQWIEHDGARREPVPWTSPLEPARVLAAAHEAPATATSASHAEARAS
jgi:radical SAM-linked protein